MNRIILSAALFAFGSFAASAQKAWITPDPINPDDSITIWVDIKKCDCQRLIGSTEPLYIWTWSPKDRAASDPTFNGQWGNSNEELKMTPAGNDVWYYRMVPTKFYGVTAGEIYDKGFMLLMKKKDGTGAGGGGCNEDKTEDLSIKVERPKTAVLKVSSFPQTLKMDTVPTSSNDVFTLIYNNNMEEKVSMKGVKDLYVFAQGLGTDGLTYQIASILQTGNKPELAMKEKATGVFTFQLRPQVFFPTLPAGVKIKTLRCQIVRKDIGSSDDTVDGTYQFHFNNDCD
jgi:hypothetical protein